MSGDIIPSISEGSAGTGKHPFVFFSMSDLPYFQEMHGAQKVSIARKIWSIGCLGISLYSILYI
jgi:hypothetical protein